MPMSQPEQERRTVQNTNDILSIYDMLSEMDAKLDKHTVQTSNLASQVDAHDARFDAVDGQLESIDGRLESIGGRLDGMGSNVEEILRRLPG
jgi:archaellum component FlaC